MEKDVERGIKHRVRREEEEGREGGERGRMVRKDEGKGEIKHNALQCVSRTVISRVSWCQFFPYMCSSGEIAIAVIIILLPY